ncbi:MAG: nucleotide sugar dehydrogenase [Smithellaceae bacterium]|jgi:UDP-N-acetyl-D-mannosaminuronic acid dehydrogenase
MSSYDICIIGGAGHVGLPLSIAFAEKGQKVMILDINKNALDTINCGKMPFLEEGCEEKLKQVIGKKLLTSSDNAIISQAKYVVVIVGTPVDEHLNPTFHNMKMLFEDILPYLKNEQIIIMRSTVYPGTTEKVRSMLKDKLPNIEVCFCPERILEGKSMEELYNLPQIVSGFNEKAIKEVSALFNLLTKDILIVKPMEAELAKVFTNTWRYIQFATANQFYMIAEEAGVDFYKVYNAMTFNYPRAKGFPRPGFAAGPCLFKDTMQTSAFAKNTFFLGHSAMLINEGLPNFVVSQLKEKHDLTKKTVGILGMAFKSESDDKRESLSYKLKKILEIEAKKVFCSDVYIKEEGFVDEKSLIEKSDIIIIGAPHKKYKKLEYQGKKIIDVWNMIE